MSKVSLSVSLIRRTTGVEVGVTGDPDEAVEKFYALCEQFDDFLGYGSKKTHEAGKDPTAIRRGYAIRKAMASRKGGV